jgi:hypothetical protein
MDNVITINFKKPEPPKETNAILNLIKEVQHHENFAEALKWIIYNSRDPADTFVYAIKQLLNEKEFAQFLAAMSDLKTYLDLDDDLRAHVDRFFELRRMVCG